MAETLIVVSILIILFALAALGIISIQRNLRQKELDAKAELIYMAAQEQLVNLHSNGSTFTGGTPQSSVAGKNVFPADMIVTYYDGEEVERVFYFVTSNSSDTDKNLILPAGIVDDELRGNRWVIEYDQANGTVYAVYYSDRENIATEYPDSWNRFDSLRVKNNRISDGAKVGYYGGDAAAMGGSASAFSPTISVENREKLIAKLQVNAPAIFDMTFDVTVKDEHGHTFTGQFNYPENAGFARKGSTITYDFVMDDLTSDSTRFASKFSESNLVPGDDITIGLSASSKSNPQIEPGRAGEATTNSLFAYLKDTADDEAIISFGRHLQNLDSSSKVKSDIKHATQIKDISFDDDKNDNTDWSDYYSSLVNEETGETTARFFNGDFDEKANFRPIRNDYLLSYDGSNDGGEDGKRILSLNVNVTEQDGNAGLFDHIANGLAISDIYLNGTTVISEKGAAGGIAGTVSGTGSITNVGLFLTADDIRSIGGGNKYRYRVPWIEGKNAGGLIGTMTGGTLKIKKSFASTVIKADEHAGGLVGYNKTQNSLEIDKSYADSYVFGQDTGGLACTESNKKIKSITDSYAAGFQGDLEDGAVTQPDSEAGLVNGAVKKAKNCYTITSKVNQSRDKASYYSTAVSIDDSDSVYYLITGSSEEQDISGTEVIGSMKKTVLYNKLGGNSGNFRTDTADAIQNKYELMGQSLYKYDYPCLKDVRHYGDWISVFQNGALVYYESYADGSYGFYGAGVDQYMLKNSVAVTGDGYGLVFKGGEGIPSTIKIKTDVSSTHTVSSSRKYPVSLGNATYYIVPLPKDVVNERPDNGFYEELIIKNGDNAEDDVKYYFNPLFAMTVVGGVDSRPDEAPKSIYIRTPRHLYSLSKHFAYFKGVTPDTTYTYRQERSLDYNTYRWNIFATETPEYQTPIGASESAAFNAAYDGECNTISNISFNAISGNYAGLFGYNTGNLRNIVVSANYNPDNTKTHYYVKGSASADTSAKYVGVIAGYNDGVINNCATAGYYLSGSKGTIHAYSNSRWYVGGLTGCNNRTVINSSADCPEVRLSSLYANVAIGGFVGQNTTHGAVSNCYSLGYIEVADARDSNIDIAGFAGSNQGAVTDSYCASALTTSGGARQHGFSPRGGAVNGCTYLNLGTYSYIDKLYIYSFASDDTEGTNITYKGMEDAAVSASANSKHTYAHPNTYKGGAYAYPFRAAVKDSSGNYVHYGDWLTVAELGMRGVFYWEHEENGSNNGYHFTYLGVTQDNREVTGTTLCNSHDDGGSITEFGYGYYVNDGSELDGEPVFTGITHGDGINTGARNAMLEQLPGYSYYPYRTDYDETQSDFMHLAVGAGQDRRSGTIVLKTKQKNGTPLGDLTFNVTPFFADAMQLENASGSITLTSSDYRTSDLSVLSGEKQNVYEIRSIDQFEFINWNYITGDCSTLVYGEQGSTQEVIDSNSNFKHFPFLQYAIQISRGIQKRSAVEQARSPQYWVQTHDVAGNDRNLTPIAGMATSSPTASREYENYMYAWFGGSYDGQSYQIKNIDLSSESYSVGLFGATAGAKIKNIILYATTKSDSSKHKIIRDTAGKTSVQIKVGPSGGTTKNVNFEKGPGAYFIGGLIGVAYEYTNESLSSISNCAIAGYEIRDESTNQQGAGTANVGGLMGLANTNLERCSAVTDIVISCTHDFGHMAYGSFVRVGGLAGSAGAPKPVLVSVDNCYSGGSISVDNRTLFEVPKGNGGWRVDSAGDHIAKRDKNTINIFVSGLIGGSYAPNISNFTNNRSNAPDGTANINNCYTYLTLPMIEGNIRAVSYFANQGDRYGQFSYINLSNCYYLEEANTGLTYENLPDKEFFYFENNSNNHIKKHRINEEEFGQMLNGNLTYLHVILNSQKQNGGTSTVSGDTPEAISYSDLHEIGVNKLGGDPWDWVTTVDEGGNEVHGKYSFSSHSGQQGMDYPFPTVVTQKDLTYSTKDKEIDAHVHYGAWPFDGWYWEDGRGSVDIFADMVTEVEEEQESITEEDIGYAEKVFYLNSNSDRAITKDDFTGGEDIAEVIRCVKDSNNKGWYVTIRAKKAGTVTIVETESEAKFVLTVTDDLALSCDPSKPLIYEKGNTAVELSAVSGKDESKSYTTEGSWDVQPESGDYECTKSTTADYKWTISGGSIGHGTVKAVFTYVYKGGSVISKELIVPVRRLGYLGLYNKTSSSEKPYQYKWRRSLSAATDPSVSGMPAGSDLYLFAPSADGDFEQVRISSIKVGSEDPVTIDKSMSELAGKTETVGSYTFEFKAIAASGELSILPVYVIGKAGDLDVTFSLTAPQDEQGVDSNSYELNAGVKVPDHRIYFNDNGSTSGRMYAVGVQDGATYVIPECGFRKSGYRFQYWEGSDGNNYKASSESEEYKTKIESVTSDITLKAIWTANTYKVKFDGNGAPEEQTMEDQTIEYDQEATLKKSTFTPPVDTLFKEWNTRQDGTGDSYEDEATVKNLTSEASITLFAQWKPENVLSLYDGDEMYWNGVPASETLVDYESPDAEGAIDGWTLDGWYTKNNSGKPDIKVLGADANIVAPNVPNYTENGKFKVKGEQSLYAVWVKEGYLSVNNLGNTDGKVEDESPYPNEDPDNGSYLIVSSKDNGKQQSMVTTGTNNNDFGSKEIMVNSCDYLFKIADDWYTSDAYIETKDADERAVWSIEHRRTSEASGKLYSIENDFNRKAGSDKNRYLRNQANNQTNTLYLINTLRYNTKLSNKQMWHYKNNVLGTQFRLEETPQYYESLYYDDATQKWKLGVKDPGYNTYLFKLQNMYTLYKD